MPMRRRSGGTWCCGLLTRSPSSQTSPALTGSNPAMARSTVVLPQPEGPSRQPTVPRARVIEKFSTTARLP
jgi:hypothetical protein